MCKALALDPTANQQWAPALAHALTVPTAPKHPHPEQEMPPRPASLLGKLGFLQRKDVRPGWLGGSSAPGALAVSAGTGLPSRTWEGGGQGSVF